MTYRPLGRSGLMVSAVGIGCNAFSRRVDLDGVRGILDAAQDVGVTLLDTADAYGVEPGASEELLGQALEGRREEFVLASKFGLDLRGANGADHGARGSRRYVRRAVEASLRRLRTDHLDLYQLHAPDPHTPIAETLAALTELVTEGKVRYVGCSNLPAWQVADAAWTAETKGLAPFVSAQDRYSLLDRSLEDQLGPACERFGLGVLPYFPLEYGPAHRQVHPRRRCPRGLPRGPRPEPGAVARERRLGPHRGAPGVRRRTRRRAARRRDRGAGRRARRRERHLGRDPRRAGAPQRRRAGLDPHR